MVWYNIVIANDFSHWKMETATTDEWWGFALPKGLPTKVSLKEREPLNYSAAA